MARTDQGWVKLHRQIMESDIGHNFLLLGLWTTLIKWANWRDGRIKWRGLPRVLERGEILTSATELAQFGNVDRKTVTKWLNYLSLRESISVEKSPKGSLDGMIIKILNYDKYNSLDAPWSHEDGHEHGHDSGHEHGHEPTHLYKNIRNKELKNKRILPVFDFESVFQKYPTKVKGSGAELRFSQQIKTQADFDNLNQALDRYLGFLAEPKNSWRSPKQTFSAFLGTKRSGYFWHDFINYLPDSGNDSKEMQEVNERLRQKYGGQAS